jgi:hypothetical protein
MLIGTLLFVVPIIILMFVEHDSNKEKFRVKYPDGKVSIPMNYKNALNYAEIFKGKIIKI